MVPANHQKPLPWLIAHRGAMAEAPENVEAAFDLAFAHGVDGIEFDIQLTEDGWPVVFHDDSLQRITGRTGSIGDYRLSELDAFDYGSWFSSEFHDQKMPTLAAVLKRYAGKGVLMIEIKSPGGTKRHPGARQRLCQAVVDAINDQSATIDKSHIRILSFDRQILSHAARMAPEIGYVMNIKKPQIVAPGKNNAFYDRIWGYCLPVAKLNRSFVSEVHGAAKHVLVYSCNSVRAVQKALDMGVDVVMTDDPGSVAPYFHGMQAKKSV